MSHVTMITVNVNIFVQCIFLRNSRRALDAQKLNESEKYNHNKTNMREKCKHANMPPGA